MKKTTLTAALASLLAPSLLSAAVGVTFDATLTNTTDWVYNSDIKNNNTGYYVAGHSAMITSPRFDFAITSVVLKVKTTGSCTRNLIISAFNPETSATNLSQTFENIPQGEDCLEISAAWKASQKVTAIAVESNKGAQNLYFLSATISGVPLIDPPDGLAAPVVKRDGFTLRWDNPDGAVSNRVEIFEIVPGKDDKGDSVEYDFSTFRNDTGNARDATDEFTNSIPAFAGSSLIRLPANSAGMIQISKDDTKGYLVHSGFADFSGMSLTVSARIPTDSQGKTFGIGYIAADGATNEVASLPLSLDFVTNTVSLADVPQLAPIIFNTQGANSKRIVHVDYLAFSDTSACVPPATNIVASFTTTSRTGTCRGLNRGTNYLVRVSAFDAEGNESDFSDPLAVRTLSTIPTKITLR